MPALTYLLAIIVAFAAIAFHYARLLTMLGARCTLYNASNSTQCIAWNLPDGFAWAQDRIDEISSECDLTCDSLGKKCWPDFETTNKASFGYRCVHVDWYPSGGMSVEEGTAKILQMRKDRADNQGLV